jgi:hypothetical protein
MDKEGRLGRDPAGLGLDRGGRSLAVADRDLEIVLVFGCPVEAELGIVEGERGGLEPERLGEGRDLDGLVDPDRLEAQRGSGVGRLNPYLAGSLMMRRQATRRGTNRAVSSGSWR